jgi:hypothetical protein
MWPDTWRAVGTGVPGAGTLRGWEAVLQFIVPPPKPVSQRQSATDAYENRYAFFIQRMSRKVWRRCHTSKAQVTVSFAEVETILDDEFARAR